MLTQAKLEIEEILAKLEENSREFGEELLDRSPAPDKWSVAQVLHHLNGYNDYYIMAIDRALRQAPGPGSRPFHPGWLGAYFTGLMKPQQGRVKRKMKAFRAHVPPAQASFRIEWERFRQGEQQLLALLDKARQADLNKTRVPISLTPLIRLKLGDTFQFLIAHQQRHLLQIQDALQMLSPSLTSASR